MDVLIRIVTDGKEEKLITQWRLDSRARDRMYIPREGEFVRARFGEKYYKVKKVVYTYDRFKQDFQSDVEEISIYVKESTTLCK